MTKGSRDIQLLELKDTILQLNKTISTLNSTIAKQQADNDNLRAELAWFRQKLFGSSSEHIPSGVGGQLSLFDSSFEEDKSVELIQPEIVKLPKKERKKKLSLKEQFIDLPVRQVLVDTLSTEEKTCSLCGTQMVAMGTEIIRSEIVYTPPKLERIEYMATTYSCPVCKESEELADGYPGYNKLRESRRCCCYAHIRRYFLEAIPKGQEKDYTHPAVQGVLYCDKLFAYERSYKEATRAKTKLILVYINDTQFAHNLNKSFHKAGVRVSEVVTLDNF